MNQLAETSSEVIAQPDLWMAGLKTFATLCLVLGILIAVLYLVKRFLFRDPGFRQGQLIRIISSCHIGPKQRVAVIDVAGEKLVIGITPENVTCLAKIEGVDGGRQCDGLVPQNAPGGVFQRLLVSSLKGRGDCGQKSG